MIESIAPDSALRQRISQLESRTAVGEAVCVALGPEVIDSALGGGLARAQLHEVFAIDPADGASAAGFCAMLAVRLGGTVLWLRAGDAERAGGALHAHGFAHIGLDPNSIIHAVADDPAAVLRAGLDVVRCPEVGVAVIELWRTPAMLDLTATRRLAVAAEASGVTPLLLRVAAEPMPSAARTRWAVTAAASVPLEANAPGHTALSLELLRQRGRPAGFTWQVEWNREQAVFRERGVSAATASRNAAAAASGAVVSLADRRALDTEDRWQRAG